MNRSILRGVVLIAIAVAVVIVLAALPRKLAKKVHPSNDDPWVLVNCNPNDPYGTYLGNGFISTRIMGDGVGSRNGKPLPCYMAGFYDDEKLIPIPTWSDLRFHDGKTRFEIDKTADYKQTLDMRTGILTTHATWRAGGKTLKGKIEVIVSRNRPHLALVHAQFAPSFRGSLRVVVPAGQASPSLKGGPMAGGHGDGSVFACDAYEASQSRLPLLVARRLTCTPHKISDNTSESGLELTMPVRAGEQACIDSYAAIYAEQYRSWDKAQWDIWHDVEADTLTAENKRAWAKLWKSDIAIDGPRKDQQVIHSCMFYLLSSVRQGSRWSIPPMGLSNNAFGGHVFWDADIWMFPALILQHPEMAKSIVEYRYHTLPGAIANAKAAGMPGAQYAWESGYTGREDTPEGLVYRHERHINGDVALAQWQYYLATGDLDWLKTRGYPVIRATADWWAAKAKWVPAKSRYEILQVVPPDESADLIDNSAYTNVIAKINLDIAVLAAKLAGERPDPKCSEVAQKMYVPFDARNRRFIAFDGYGVGQFGPRYQAKQADTELLIYPLQYQIPGQSMTDIYRNTFDYYSRRVHKGGPAMTSSAHSVIAARLGDRDRAYAGFVRSYKPFLRGPFNYFNEKPSKYLDNMCFLTGAAGPVQAVLFGIAGIRMDYSGKPELTHKACLPKQWKSLKITGLRWRGKMFDLTIPER